MCLVIHKVQCLGRAVIDNCGKKRVNKQQYKNCTVMPHSAGVIRILEFCTMKKGENTQFRQVLIALVQLNPVTEGCYVPQGTLVQEAANEFIPFVYV